MQAGHLELKNQVVPVGDREVGGTLFAGVVQLVLHGEAGLLQQEIGHGQLALQVGQTLAVAGGPHLFADFVTIRLGEGPKALRGTQPRGQLRRKRVRLAAKDLAQQRAEGVG